MSSGPQHPVAGTSSRDERGRPICCYCNKPLRWRINGYGYSGSGHFCNVTCAAEWADLKIMGTGT